MTHTRKVQDLANAISQQLDSQAAERDAFLEGWKIFQSNLHTAFAETCEALGTSISLDAWPQHGPRYSCLHVRLTTPFSRPTFILEYRCDLNALPFTVHCRCPELPDYPAEALRLEDLLRFGIPDFHYDIQTFLGAIQKAASPTDLESSNAPTSDPESPK